MVIIRRIAFFAWEVLTVGAPLKWTSMPTWVLDLFLIGAILGIILWLVVELISWLRKRRNNNFLHKINITFQHDDKYIQERALNGEDLVFCFVGLKNDTTRTIRRVRALMVDTGDSRHPYSSILLSLFPSGATEADLAPGEEQMVMVCELPQSGFGNIRIAASDPALALPLELGVHTARIEIYADDLPPREFSVRYGVDRNARYVFEPET